MRRGLADQGVSLITGFIMNLAVAILVMSLVLLTAQGYMNNFTERSTETELRVAGERIASRFVAADRFVRRSNDSAGSLTLDPPPIVVGSGYTAKVREDSGAGDNGTIYVHADDVDVNVSVPFNTTTPVDDAEFRGNTRSLIEYNQSKIVVVE